MLKWLLLSSAAFFIGSDTGSLIDAAVKGQNLTDRGVWIGLLIVFVVLLVWFAKMQFAKEEKMTEKLAKLNEESTKVIKEMSEKASESINANTLAMQALRNTIEIMSNNIRAIDEHQQSAAKAADERDRRRRAS